MHVRQRLGASERHACHVLGQPRSTQRRVKKVRVDESALRTDVIRLASRFGRYGYRQITNLLRIEGWEVNLQACGAYLEAGGAESAQTATGSSPELCVKVRGSSSMLLLGCLGDLLRFEKREIQVATFAPDRSSP